MAGSISGGWSCRAVLPPHAVLLAPRNGRDRPFGDRSLGLTVFLKEFGTVRYRRQLHCPPRKWRSLGPNISQWSLVS